MKIQYIRGIAPLHMMKVAAAATLVLAVFFVLFSFAIFQTKPVFSGENSAPVGVDSSFTMAEGGSHTGSVSGTDADGDTLTFQLASGPSSGTLTFNSDGSFSYSAHRQTTIGFESEDSFTFKANDGALLSEPARVTITITPVNDAPAAHESSFSVDAGQTYSGSVTGSDLDGDTLSFVQLSAPMYGTLSFSAPGSFTYTADTDYAGPDSFTFKANDGLEDSSPATVTVNIEGQEVLVDEVLSGSLSEWTVDSPSGNPVFTYEEIVSPHDESTALKTSVVGTTISLCNQPNISRVYPVVGNTDSTQLQAYLAFTSTMETYTFPYVVVEIYDDEDERVGFQIYYGKAVIGQLYASYANNNPESYTELPTAEGDVTLDLSVMGEDIDFTSIKVTLANYACIGQNSVTFDHLRVINGVIREDNSNQEEGTAENPSKISSCQEFQAIDNNIDWHYELLQDIDCSDTENWNGGSGLLPIRGLSGSLDGNGFTVSNIFINTSESGGVFLANSGSIKNINFRNIDISGGGYSGGLVNNNFGLIEKSSITGKVTCGSQQCGGFAGTNSGTISRSWADIEISGPNYVGTIVGHSYGGRVENCYAKGKMNSASQSGGLVGLNESTTIVNSYSTSLVNESLSNGGLIGWMYQHGSQSGSYWNKELSGKENMCGKQSHSGSGCTDDNGLTDEEMKNADYFVGWDFEDIWSVNPKKNDGYPYLRWQTMFTNTDTTAPVITLNGPSSVSLTVGDTYQEQGATATDDSDGTVEVVVIGGVDTDVVGIYTITYTATDTAGNMDTMTRTVTVLKPEPSPGRRSSQIISGVGTFDPSNGTGAQNGEVLGLRTSVISKQQLIDLQMQLIEILRLYLRLFGENKV